MRAACRAVDWRPAIRNCPRQRTRRPTMRRLPRPLPGRHTLHRRSALACALSSDSGTTLLPARQIQNTIVAKLFRLQYQTEVVCNECIIAVSTIKSILAYLHMVKLNFCKKIYYYSIICKHDLHNAQWRGLKHVSIAE